MNTHARHPLLTQEQARRLAPLGAVARATFELLAESPTPLKAYELLWRLQTKRGRPSPPSTIYRSLASLTESGLVHRIETLNAYAPCVRPEIAHEPLFFICDRCHVAIEADVASTAQRLRDRIDGAGFRSSRLRLEFRGLCVGCR